MRPPPADPGALFTTGLLWLVFVSPLLLLAYDLGAQHTEARRFNTSVWRGLRESWRVAWQRVRLDEMAEEFAQRPEDDVMMAILYGISGAAMPPALFLGVMPTLRTERGVIWVGGAGVLFGVATYCHRRAAALLPADPRPWGLFLQGGVLNPARDDADGRPFVPPQTVWAVRLPGL